MPHLINYNDVTLLPRILSHGQDLDLNSDEAKRNIFVFFKVYTSGTTDHKDIPVRRCTINDFKYEE